MENLVGTKVYIQRPDEGDFVMLQEVLVTRVIPDYSLIEGTLLNRFCYHSAYRKNGRFLPFSIQQNQFAVILDDKTKLVDKPAEFDGHKRSNYFP